MLWFATAFESESELSPSPLLHNGDLLLSQGIQKPTISRMSMSHFDPQVLF